MMVLVDALICLSLIGLAVQVVISTSLFRAVTVFITFGVLMALAWARLYAPDLAIAEAALGAGIMGALLLNTLRRLGNSPDQDPFEEPNGHVYMRFLVAMLSAAIALAIALAALEIPGEQVTAGDLILERMPQTGIGNPITAVLVLFRGHDTLVEVVVLVLVYAGAMALLARPGDSAPRLSVAADMHLELPRLLASLIAPLTLLIAVYLLKTGSNVPGGAFQGGAVLAGGGTLLLLSGRLHPVEQISFPLALGLVSGVLGFLGIGFWMLATGHAMLAIPGTWAIYLIEFGVMLSIAVALTLLLGGTRGLVRMR